MALVEQPKCKLELAPMVSFPKKLSPSFRRKKLRKTKKLVVPLQLPQMMIKMIIKVNKKTKKVLPPINHNHQLRLPKQVMYSLVQQLTSGKVSFLRINGLAGSSPHKRMLKPSSILEIRCPIQRSIQTCSDGLQLQKNLKTM